MNLKGWGTHWEWERSKEVAIFAMNSKVDYEKPTVVKELEGVLKEFSIPLEVTDGNLKHGDNVAQIRTLVDNSIKDEKINYDEFERQMGNARKEGRLQYGLVVLVDKDKYTFYQPPEQKDRAI